ncbi:hypothetical protein G9A89_007098 [Geosiphon pyriformis]|nr:hypothetical protein G9A89_007098 [Geosiphon pyriformis]
MAHCLKNYSTSLKNVSDLVEPKLYKGKGRLQTPAVTPKQIQPFTWKKTKVELPTNPSYHYTPGSTINILLAVIIINQPPIELIIEPIQQQPLQPPQQLQQSLSPLQQQFQQPPQQQIIVPMAYAPIAKLEKFTGKEDDAQVWLNNVKKTITANEWNDTRAMQAIPYFLQDTANL